MLDGHKLSCKGSGSIPSTGCNESEIDQEIFTPVPDVA